MDGCTRGRSWGTGSHGFGWIEGAPVARVQGLTYAAGVGSPDDTGSNTVKAVAKGAVFALGTIMAIGIGLAIVKSVLPLVVLGGAAYLGFRMVKKNKALAEPESRKALGSADDFDRRMAELDAVEKKLDAEIRRGS